MFFTPRRSAVLYAPRSLNASCSLATSFVGTGSYQSSYTSRYCSAGCPDTWIGDRYCDRACNVPACGYDGTDCGVTDMAANLFHVNLSSWEVRRGSQRDRLHGSVGSRS